MKAVRLYAQVLADVATAPNSGVKLDALLVELNSFNTSTSGSAIFSKVFANPTLGDDEKQKALAELMKQAGLSPLSSRFLSLLARRNRLEILAEILKSVEQLQVERSGGLTGELVSAMPLAPDVVTGIQSALAKRLNKPITLKQKVDPSLIAGMRVTVSGVTYDGSVRGKLDKFAESTIH
jgi:F-type H+-transporting ATPase subunit delta